MLVVHGTSDRDLRQQEGQGYGEVVDIATEQAWFLIRMSQLRPVSLSGR